MSIQLHDKMEEVLKNVPENRHSYFQLKYFVIGKEPTHQARLWKCLKELQIRKESIDYLTFKLEEANDNMELIEIKAARLEIDDSTDELSKREQIILMRGINREKNRLESSIKHLQSELEFAKQEARYFLEAYEGLNKIEPLKDFDDLESQKEYWNERISQEINLRLLLRQPLNMELVETALALDEDMPIKKQLAQSLIDHQTGLERIANTKSNKS